MAALLELLQAPRPVRERSECNYTACYCEENVYNLCADLLQHLSADCLFAIFISNPQKQVPLWRQKAGRSEDGLVFWDYHVVLLEVTATHTFVWDLDSTLPFPCSLQQYEREALCNGGSSLELPPQLWRRFRVVSGKQFLQHFASDRSHMHTAGVWSAPPPRNPCITSTGGETMTLPGYLDMGLPATGRDPVVGLPGEEPYGRVYREDDFIALFMRGFADCQ